MKENILEFPDRKLVQDEAAVWLIKLDGDEAASPEVLASLHEWLARSPVHRQELQRLAFAWRRMNVLTELAVPLGDMKTTKSPWLHSTLLQVQALVARVQPNTMLSSLLLCVMVFALYVVAADWPLSDPYLASNGVYTTRIGEQKMTTLADGSVIRLNTNSEVRVDYGQGFRDMRLVRGEAEFNVAKNPAQPFRVYAGNERVQAIGTAFTVYLQTDKIDVLVTEGQVALATRSDEHASIDSEEAQRSSITDIGSIEYVETLRELKAGQSASVNVTDDGGTSLLSAVEVVDEPADIARRLAWREGLLIFDGDPLEDVVREVSRYTSVAIEITDPDVRTTKIGGQFPAGETDVMLAVLESSFGFQITRLSANRVLISAANE